MTSPSTIVVIGGSLGGAKAAEAARDAGFSGRVVLVSEEPGAPYERPPLSKAVLRGEAEPTSARVHPRGFYTDHEIEIVSDRVSRLDLHSRRVELAGGGGMGFEAAVLATGAAPRRLDLPGSELAGIHYLRTAEDAVRLRDAIRSASRVAVIGAGWIGSEVAASARQMGADVILVDPAPVPLQRVLGDRIGEVFRQLHSDHGVQLRMTTSVTALRGDKAVEAIVLDRDREEEADLVVAGVGVTPRVELARTTALRVDNGIVVDQYLETSVPGIYAAGDVANAWHPHFERHVRVEHWANAVDQGTTAGGNAAGRRDEYCRLPYFFSDQFDLGMEYVGHGEAGDQVVVRGDLAARRFIAFWHRDGVVTAAMNVNEWDVVDDLRAIVESRRPVSLGRLSDPDVPLSYLVS